MHSFPDNETVQINHFCRRLLVNNVLFSRGDAPVIRQLQAITIVQTCDNNQNDLIKVFIEHQFEAIVNCNVLNYHINRPG